MMRMNLAHGRGSLRLIAILLVATQVACVASASAKAPRNARGPRLETSPTLAADDDVLTARDGRVQIIASATRRLAYATIDLDDPWGRANPVPATPTRLDEPILDARKVQDISQW